MNCNHLKLNCSKELFGKILKNTLMNCKIAGNKFRLKECKDGFILKPQKFLQKNACVVNCKYRLERITDNETKVEITYSLSVSAKLFLGFLLYVLYSARTEIITSFDLETVFVLILFITIPIFFYVQDRKACQDFWEQLLGELKGR